MLGVQGCLRDGLPGSGSAAAAVVVALVVGALGPARAGADFVSFSTDRVPGVELRQIASATVSAPLGPREPLAGAGDVNGDGYGDVIVGSDAAGEMTSGKAFVVFGRPGSAILNVERLDGGGFEIRGSQPYGCRLPGGDEPRCGLVGQTVGWAVAGAGDVNGDGLADVVVGAPHTVAGGRVLAGAAYVVFGKRSADAVDLGDLGEAGFEIRGARADDRLGSAVAGLGDANGDGLADVAVSATGPGPERPSVFVVFGKRDVGTVDVADPGERARPIKGARAAGTGSDGCCGVVSVAAAGDHNGDGLADVAVGSPGEDARGRSHAGTVFVVYGSAASETVDVGQLGAGGYRIDGGAAGDHAGSRVAAAGDFNGDGRDDLLVNVVKAAGGGGSWVVFGRPPGTNVDLGQLGPGGIALEGELWPAPALGGAGDVNGDGLDDVIVGAGPDNPDCRPFASSAYVVFGRSSAGVLRMDGLGLGGYRLAGASLQDRPGLAVAGAGDFNGDGAPDVITGSPSLSFGDPVVPHWTARVTFALAPRESLLRPPEQPCLEVRVPDRRIRAVLKRARLRARVTSRGPYAKTLGVVAWSSAAFRVEAFRRIKRPGVYNLTVALDRRARRYLARHNRVRVSVNVTQYGHPRHCERAFPERHPPPSPCGINAEVVRADLTRPRAARGGATPGQ